MSEFKEGAKLRREVRIHGVEKPVQLEISVDGISFWIKGHRKRTTLTWSKAAAASQTGQDVPSFLMGDALGLLKHQAKNK